MLPRHPEIAIVGAGAAGLAAAWRLGTAGVETVVLEARRRVGGRAWMVESGGLPLDLGCGWLHSADRNPWREIARNLGFAIDRTEPGWGKLVGGHASPAVERSYRAARARFHSAVRAAAERGAEAAAASLVAPDHRWRPMLDAISSYANGVELDRLSILDYAAYDAADTGINWRVREGLGAAIAAFAEGMPIALDHPVTMVEHDGPAIRLLSPRAGEVTANAVIVTVSTNVLAAGGLRFRPALPDKVQAAEHLPLGIANKLYLEADAAAGLPENGHAIGSIRRSATGAYALRPLGRPIVEAFFGGACARDLEAGGLAGFADFAIEELAGLFGNAVKSRLRPLAATAWHGDPWARGSYSHALPGHAGDRDILARPVDDRLFFAGEACSEDDFSTAHGAYLTGVRAAEAVLRTRRPKGTA